MSQYTTLQLEFEDAVAVCTLSRPDKHNAISPEMLVELPAALGEIEASSARVAIITGQGRSFCAGMDLAALRKVAEQSPQQNEQDARRVSAMFRRLWSFPKPLIAAVNGNALAGGCGIATLCDFTIASTEARFGYTEVRIGFIPALVSMYLAPQVGEKVARDLLLTGRILGAEEARTLGLVNSVVNAQELMWAARELASTLAANSAGSLAATKRLLVEPDLAEMDRRIEIAIRESVAIRSTDDFREGLAAFLEKRKPRWTHGSAPHDGTKSKTKE